MGGPELQQLSPVVHDTQRSPVLQEPQVRVRAGCSAICDLARRLLHAISTLVAVCHRSAKSFVQNVLEDAARMA